MRKKSIFSDKNRGEKIIDFIRDNGGTIFIDPCPIPPSTWGKLVDILKKKLK